MTKILIKKELKVVSPVPFDYLPAPWR